jgi:hypothetical protein
LVQRSGYGLDDRGIAVRFPTKATLPDRLWIQPSPFIIIIIINIIIVFIF